MKYAKLSQHAVGQGGLAAGEFSAGGEPIRWIYDCGSNQSDSLLREIVKLHGKPLDLLFLSHLDNDHVNGIELLLSTCIVKEVVLPYLTEGERLLVIGEGLATGQLTKNLHNFVADPVIWLQGRGVTDVTFVRANGEGDGGLALPRDPSPDTQGELKTSWSVRPTPIKSGWAKGGAIGEPGATIHVEGRGHALVADWVFLPQVHRPTASRARAFAKAIAARFSGQSAMSIVTSALDLKGRLLLREAYDSLWKDHNKLTMSLYAGPLDVAGRWKCTVRWPAAGKHKHGHWHFFEPFLPTGVGWLSSGDADLSAPRRRGAFLKFYQAVLPNVGVFVVPHHGAAESFDRSLLDAMPGFRIGVAAAGSNGYGHPHRLVRDAVNAAGIFAQVDEQEISTLTTLLFEA